MEDRLPGAMRVVTGATPLKLVPPAVSAWQPIASAPSNRSVLLFVSGTHVPVYCGRWRAGTLGEPQPHVLAWRCDSSGRFAHPTQWMDLPQPPKD
jgi:hypothetical protein